MKETSPHIACRVAAGELPILVTLGALVISWALVRPWGDFPLNDDWTYAHLAKQLGELGVLKLDVPIAPNAIGQAWLGAGVVRLFGFSHTVLRLLTMGVGLGGLWVVDLLLRQVTPRVAVRTLALLGLAFNPIYFYSSTTFMNELYGWVPALLGAALWMWDRRRLEVQPNRVISWWVALLVAAWCGLAFWTRQFGVLIFPALLGATALRFALDGRWRAVLRALPVVLLAFGVFVAAIWAYFAWAKASGNYRPEFATRLDNLTRFSAKTYGMQGGAVVGYMTLYFLPLLLLLRWRGAGALAFGSAAVLLAALAVAQQLFQATAMTDFWVGPIWNHKSFPWIVNIVWNAGLGPVTLDDAFFFQGPVPTWPKAAWTAVTWVMFAGAVQWGALAYQVRKLVTTRRTKPSTEVVLFGAFLAIGCALAIVQAHQDEMVDRYHLPVIIGLFLVVPSALEHQLESFPLAWWSWATGGIAWALIAAFSVAGAHDQFRWNEARWRLVNRALATGGTRATVQGGWEVNCWFRHEGIRAEEMTCAPRCGCAYAGFCCLDDTWRLGMSVSPGYSAVESAEVSYWLARGPPVVLSKRATPE